MDATRLKALRADLLRQRGQMTSWGRSERAALRGSTDERAGVGDEGDRSSLDLLAGLDAALLQIRAETLEHINDALDRLDRGTYGVCQDCGDQIPIARLRAVPFARRCRSCEEAGELNDQAESQLANRRRLTY